LKKITIVGIAPFNGLKVSMEKVADYFPDVQFSAYIGDLMEGVEIAQTFNSDEVDVIISRGGTALLLKQHTDIPVVEIDVSIYDIMRTVRLAQSFSGKMAVVGFENITDRANVLNDLLNLSIDVINIDNEENAENVLLSLKENSYEVIVCDQITSALARKIGLNAILINSVEETITKSFEQAIEIGKTRLKIKEHYQLLKAINKKNSQLLLVLDNDYNERKEFSSQSIPNKIKNKLINIRSSYMNVPTVSFKEVYNGTVYFINTEMVNINDDIYTVFYISMTEIISPSNKNIELKHINYDKEDREDLLFNSSLSLGSYKKEIVDYAKYKDPIFLIGESGTGKDKLAQLIAEHAEKTKFWEINCEQLTRPEWDNLLNSPNSPLQDDNTTIYLKEIRHLPLNYLNQFLYFAEHTLLFKRNKVVVSSTIEAGESSQEIVSRFKNWPIIFYTTISLRERKADIPSIASLYINEFNNDYGKQIIGFEPYALERLTNFDWPGNQSQFKRVIKQLILRTTGAYITDRDTLELLKNEIGHTKSSSSNLLQLDQSLEEINYDIIQIILNEEKGNKTKTAERLGISRSTLWRILNKFN